MKSTALFGAQFMLGIALFATGCASPGGEGTSDPEALAATGEGSEASPKAAGEGAEAHANGRDDGTEAVPRAPGDGSEDGRGAAKQKPAVATLKADDGSGVELAGDGRVALGRLQNDDLRDLIHSALEERISKDGPASETAEEKIELGDVESFQFTVVKLSRGPDDISGDPAETPDGLEVEVNGWYKRTLSQKDAGEPEISCVSFDTYARVTKHGKRWSVPKDYQVSFNREDNEDCY